MISMDVDLEGEGAFSDLKDKEFIHLGNDAPPIRITALKGGMTSGRTSVAMAIDNGDNKIVFFETSLRLFLTIANMLRAKYGEE